MTRIRAKNTKSVYAIPAHSGSLQVPEEHNTRIEPIDNGFVKHETHYGADGSFKSSKHYHPTHPGLSAEKPKAGPSPLRTAIAHATGKKK